jgi:uncharacterized small protein (DUF1192 family)
LTEEELFSLFCLLSVVDLKEPFLEQRYAMDSLSDKELYLCYMQELRGMVMVQQQMLVRLLAAQGLAEHEPSDDLLETVCLLEIRCDTLRDENARLTAELRKRSNSPLPQQMQP